MTSLYDRLESAALAVTASDCIRERLYKAWSRHLADLEPRDLPRELRDDFATLCDALSRERALPGDSVLRASLRKMSNEESGRHAALIVRMYARLAALRTAPIAVVPRVPPVAAVFLLEPQQAAAG